MPPYLRLAVPNYARRQQYRRLSHASKSALASAIAGLLGLAVASAGGAALGGLLLLTAIGLGLRARHWLSLARRSRVGARSEDEVQRELAPFKRRLALRHVAVAVETKTRTYEHVILPASMSRRCGCRVAGGDGAVAARWRSLVSSEYVGCSASRAMSWSIAD